jgi:magnesium transporter
VLLHHLRVLENQSGHDARRENVALHRHLADLLRDLPENVHQQVLRSMDSRDRERLNAVLAYEPDTAGGLMNTDTVSVRPDVTLETVLRYLRMRGEIPDNTEALFVVNRHDRHLGTLDLTRLLTEDPERTVGEVMNTAVPAIAPGTPATEVAGLFEDRDLLSAAVVGPDGRLLGRITVDDVVDIIREEASHSVMSMAGLDEDVDMFAGVVPSARRRGLWLGVNLGTAFLAAWVVGLFETTIENIVALAVLMPIVASMGGVAATQTLTLIVRGIALGQVERSNARWLLTKEIAVALLNGVAWATVVAAVTFLWFRNWKIAAVIFAAMMVNLFAAALAGVLVPLTLRRLGVDPAVAGGVVVTTVTDVVGFASLLGLGTWVLM